MEIKYILNKETAIEESITLLKIVQGASNYKIHKLYKSNNNYKISSYFVNRENVHTLIKSNKSKEISEKEYLYIENRFKIIADFLDSDILEFTDIYDKISK